MLFCEDPGLLGCYTVLNGHYLFSDCCVLSHRSSDVCERCVRDGLSSNPAEALDVLW
jgi:hypothetical protein